MLTIMGWKLRFIREPFHWDDTAQFGLSQAHDGSWLAWFPCYWVTIERTG